MEDITLMFTKKIIETIPEKEAKYLTKILDITSLFISNVISKLQAIEDG